MDFDVEGPRNTKRQTIKGWPKYPPLPGVADPEIHTSFKRDTFRK